MDSPHLGGADEGWPTVTITRELGSDPAPKPPGTVVAGEAEVTVWLLGGGRLDVLRDGLTVRLLTPEPVSDDAVLHPYLGLPAAFIGLWLGRHALHGGAFVHDGGAWALLADKEGGKSSTLGCLLRRGHPILTDDILVLDGATLFAGPRAVDLRAEAAAILGGDDLGIVGSRERFRLESGEAPPSAELRGIIQLEWGETATVEPLGAAERLRGLVVHSVLRPDVDPGAAARLLELASLPTFRFTRPRRVEDLEARVDQLLAALPG